MKIPTLVLVPIVGAMFALWGSAHSQESPLSPAEEAARDYMAAFLTGDVEVAAALTHPDTHERLRTLLLRELDQGSTPEDFGISLSVDEIRELNPQRLYAKFTEAIWRSWQDAAEAMRDARVEVIASRGYSADTVIVQLRTLTPNGRGGLFVQEGEFFLKRTGEAWKVVADETQQRDPP